LVIPKINVFTDNVIDQEALIIRCKTASLPEYGIDIIESHFMGQKQLFAGKPSYGSNTLVTNIDETEDQLVQRGLWIWKQKWFDNDPLSPTGGYSKFANKRSGVAEIILQCHKFNGAKMEYDWHFINAWPSNVGAVDLGMENSAKITPSVTWTFDFPQLVKG
jgi:hypothetical protein